VKPKVYFVEDTDIDPALIDTDALFVLESLRNAGHTAYLVGGSVRDLLTKRVPKDFDISTSALPEEIKKIFQRRCILIGRRFRLAHVRFGPKIFEVSTFRSGENADDLIVHDNEWGTPEEDVLRRDFTINGLFYDSSNHSVIDFVGGWDDIHKGVLKTIGMPEVRFRQDPVRILRLIKFQARFGFKIDQETKNAVAPCIEEIRKSSQARILEEILRMLESGAAEPFFRLLAEHNILNILFPSLTRFIHTPVGKEVFHYLSVVDKLYKHKGKNTLDRAVLSSCLVYTLLEQELDMQYLSKKRMPHLGEITILTSELVKRILTEMFTHFPRRISAMMIAIIVGQYRLTPLSGKRTHHERMFRHKDFELALIFFKLRALVNEKLVDTYSTIRNHYREHLHHGGHRQHHHNHPHGRRRKH